MRCRAFTLGSALALLVAAAVAALVPAGSRVPSAGASARAGSPVAATPAATPAGVTGNAYESPTFGWRLAWDDDVWSVEEAWSRGGTDRLRLGTGAGTSAVTFSAYQAHDGDASRCIRQPIAFRPTQPGTADVRVVEGPTGDAARTWLVLAFVFTEEPGGAPGRLRSTPSAARSCPARPSS